MNQFSGNFKSIHGNEIHLEISEKNPSCVVINVINLNYEKEYQKSIKHILSLLILTTFYLIFSKHYFLLHSIIFISFTFLLYKLINIVKSEHIIFTKEFALQKCTQYILNFKNRSFLLHCNIQDIVINEVICDLSVKYILVVRTKEDVFKTKPIIQLLEKLEPRVDCLEIIYNVLRKKSS